MRAECENGSASAARRRSCVAPCRPNRGGAFANPGRIEMPKLTLRRARLHLDDDLGLARVHALRFLLSQGLRTPGRTRCRGS